jgi:hypothetical protein
MQLACRRAAASTGGGRESARLLFFQGRDIGVCEAFVPLRPGVLPQGSPTVGRARRRRGANAEEERKVFGRWRLSLRGSACSEQAFGDTGVAGDDEKGEVADGQRVDVAIRSGRAGSASARGDGGGVLIVCITSCRVSTIRWRITCEVPTVVGPF